MSQFYSVVGGNSFTESKASVSCSRMTGRIAEVSANQFILTTENNQR